MKGDRIANSRKIPVVFCVDIEPDEFFVDRKNPRPWSGFEFSHGYLAEFRSRFEAVTGRKVQYSWFLRMDPQVAISYGSPAWAAERYQPFFDDYRRHGDELALHVHTYRWSRSRDKWLDDCGNPEWVSECLQSSVDSFRAVFGEPARSLRFGNFWLSTAAVNQAEELGLEFDLTVEPGLDSVRHYASKPPQTEPTPDFYRVPRSPYVPSRGDFRKPDVAGESRRITMMPLTSAYLSLGWGVRDTRCRLGRLRRNGFAGRLQNQPLSMWRKWDGRNSFSAMLDRATGLQKRPYLAFAVRSDMNGKDFERYDHCLNALLEHPLSSNFVFCTPRDAVRILDEPLK